MLVIRTCFLLMHMSIFYIYFLAVGWSYAKND